MLAFARVFNMTEGKHNIKLFRKKIYILISFITDWLLYWTQIDRNHSELLEIDCKTQGEAKTWKFLKMRLILLLKVFSTTLHEDQEMIDGKGSNKIGHIRTMCIQFRILEKTLLTNALAYVNERTSILDTIENDINLLDKSDYVQLQPKSIDNDHSIVKNLTITNCVTDD